MTTFDDLRELIPPPATGASPAWPDVAARLGFTPPADFTQIVEHYGAGVFAGEVAVWVPGGDGGEDLYECAPPALEELAESRDWIADNNWHWTEPDGTTGPVELGGEPLQFSAWGGGSSGAYGYWHHVGDDPDQWPILYTDLRDLWFYHRGGIAAFLVDLLSGQFHSDQIELDLPDGPDFESFTT